MSLNLLEKNIITSHTQLKELFLSGCKQDFQVGLEFEKLPVQKQNHRTVDFYDKNGISTFLTNYKKTDDWQFIEENGQAIGLKNANGAITLEPGCQFELSLLPKENIHSIKQELDKHNTLTGIMGDFMDFNWLGYGVQPVSTYHNINIIPKKRYEFMTEYLPRVANLPLIMMRETAGVQVAFDYSSEQDAIRKLSLTLKLSPIVSTMFSNSPIRDGKDTGYKSFRASSWLDTDPKRCGLISEKLLDNPSDFSFNDYIETILDVPMIFIEKDSKCIPLNGITFREYMNKGFKEYQATIDDWYSHLSLYFPDVRLKNYIEIRNHDSQRADLILAIPALWKGLIYEKQVLEETEELLSKFNYSDFEEIRHSGPKLGLEYKIKNIKLSEIAKEIVRISKEGLIKQNQGEETYIEPLEELVKQGLTPADIILKNWYGSWNQDISKLIKYTRIV